VIVRSLEEIHGTARDVRAETFASRRLLLAKDGMGFSLHDTVLHTGTVTEMRYANHVEAVYCIAGRAHVTDLRTRDVHVITPGVLYALDDHDHHVLEVVEEFRAVCVFNPPLLGPEVHDETGAYPAAPPEAAE
jgi:L-ectoine synthase